MFRLVDSARAYGAGRAYRQCDGYSIGRNKSFVHQ